MGPDVTLMLIGALLSAAVTLGVAWWASRAARRSLHLTGLLLRGMEEAGLVKWNRDEKGNPTGIKIELEIQSARHAVSSDAVNLRPPNSP